MSGGSTRHIANLLITTPLDRRRQHLMHSAPLLLAPLSALAASRVRCNTGNPGPALIANHENLYMNQNESLAPAQQRIAQTYSQQSIAVDTFFHAVSNDSIILDNIDEVLIQQLAVINNLYAPHSISFQLKGTTKTLNSTWAFSGDDNAMHTALRNGTYSTLNIYFLTQLQGNVLGVCSLPTSPPGNDSSDGCSVDIQSLPGGAYQGFNEGKTAVHEIGHWFGLLHTFQDNTCDGGDSGDFVSDTPQESEATSGCPQGKDSCPGSPGSDPIQNYMDYSTDECYSMFTDGQEQRMYQMFDMYRRGN
ncbi:MAG: hypothetical protein M1824_000897 [Vezdaea acicularis]|nr:MAG: hypothetical protein M1824_000897 [Vezdaea acicularis]